MTTAQMKQGDFSTLAESYSTYRSAYAPSVRSAILGLLGRPASELDAVDVGAGTGIWTRMVADAGFRSVVAVEPNDAMRLRGQADSDGYGVTWRAGHGADTGLPDQSADLLSMASSFHWVDFEAGTDEFSRVLRPGGWFVALWNPRRVEASPLLSEIENQLTKMKPELVRVSSGAVDSLKDLADRLIERPGFDDVVQLEGRHVVRQTLEQYIGAWRSVNDVQAQLGPERFEEFIDFATERVTAAGGEVETTYLTRAWAARRADNR